VALEAAVKGASESAVAQVTTAPNTP
jgi:hypothetical protein